MRATHCGQCPEVTVEDRVQLPRRAVYAGRRVQFPRLVPTAGGFFYPPLFFPARYFPFFEVIGMFPYGSQRWKNKRAHILRLDGYVDQYAKRWGRTLDAVIVHHIYPAEEYPEYAWENWNLISISRRTHELLEDRKTGKLTEAGRKLMESTTPGRDWRLTSKRFATR